MTQTIVLGLDCIPPSLIFDMHPDCFPTLRQLAATGSAQPLRSTSPPITLPAWISMFSGKDPGELGIYGFRNRKGYHAELHRTNDVRTPRLWQQLATGDRHTVSLFAPLSRHEESRETLSIGGFLSKDPSLENLARARTFFSDSLPYIADVDAHRSGSRENVIREVNAMLDQHFQILNDLWNEDSPWHSSRLSHLNFVEIGTDRLHHACWDRIDPAHPNYIEDKITEQARSYYKDLDARIGRFVDRIDTSQTHVFVVSDHGAQPLLQSFGINDWLLQEGYLMLKEKPCIGSKIDASIVDWKRTQAWAWGGYCSRLFLNLRGREAAGIVRASARRPLLEEIKQGLDEHFNSLRMDLPRDVYRSTKGSPPDAVLYADELATRFHGTVGYNALFRAENDSGFDTCNHAWNGIFLSSQKLDSLPQSIEEVAPLIRSIHKN